RADQRVQTRPVEAEPPRPRVGVEIQNGGNPILRRLALPDSHHHVLIDFVGTVHGVLPGNCAAPSLASPMPDSRCGAPFVAFAGIYRAVSTPGFAIFPSFGAPRWPAALFE